MPKFYAQCGTLSVVLSADSPEQAALSVLDQNLQNHLWIYDDPDLDEQLQQDYLMVEALLYLDPSIRISEQGFDRGDAIELGVPEVVLRWHALMACLHALVADAGLAPRSLAIGDPTTPVPSTLRHRPR